MDVCGVTSQIMELKTSTPYVTRHEEIKTGFKNINDYSKYLQEKYPEMNTGTKNMYGVPVTVTVSSAFLEKCNKDPQKAAFLEENLAVTNECVKRSVALTKNMPGSPVMTFMTIEYDSNGEITMTSACTNDPDGKIASENAKRKADEARAAHNKNEKRRLKKKKEKEAEEKQRLEKLQNTTLEMQEYIGMGTDLRAITENIFGSNGKTSFDLKA